MKSIPSYSCFREESFLSKGSEDPWQTGIKVTLYEKLDAGQDEDSKNDETAGESEHTCSNEIDDETVTQQAETKNHDNSPTDFSPFLNKMGLDSQALLFIDSLKAWHPSREDLTNGFIQEVFKQDSPTIKVLVKKIYEVLQIHPSNRDNNLKRLFVYYIEKLGT